MPAARYRFATSPTLSWPHGSGCRCGLGFQGLAPSSQSTTDPLAPPHGGELSRPDVNVKPLAHERALFGAAMLEVSDDLGNLVRAARVGFAFCQKALGPERTSAVVRGDPGRPNGFPAQRSPERWRASPIVRPRATDAVGASPNAAPKRHWVGRVARRARPELSCHCNIC